MLIAERHSQFKRDYKTLQKQHKKMEKLQEIMLLLIEEKAIPQKYKDHRLVGDWRYHRELHIEPDWLLIYKYIPEQRKIVFVRTGSHSDLFG